MKEAMGEAYLTVITILLIGVIMSTFYFVIPNMLSSIQDKSCCISNNGTVQGNNCVVSVGKKYYKSQWIDSVKYYSLKGFNLNYCK